MKKSKIWKYVLVAALVLVVAYAVFQVTRENFASANPLPTRQDFVKTNETIAKKFDEVRAANPNKLPANIDETVRDTSGTPPVKKLYDYIIDNIVPLIPPEAYPYVPTEEQKKMNTWVMILVFGPKIMPQLADIAAQSPTAPDFSAWVDQVTSQVIPDFVNNPVAQKLIPLTKSYTSTINVPAGILLGPNGPGPAVTIPNPAYWTYKYIYGNPPSMGSKVVPPPSSTGKSSSCHPSLKGIPGGVDEVKCFD